MTGRWKIGIVAMALMWVTTACGEDELQMPPWTEWDAPVEMGLVNYLGNKENIHPKVLHFDEPWGGHCWWMAYTPYPKGNTRAENPCIAASDDGLHWDAPTGLRNPLALCPAGGYNSDTHLIYNPVDNTLECWWRAVDNATESDCLLRRISRDGVGWTEPDTVLQPVAGVMDHLSPAVSIVDGRYLMMYCDVNHVVMMRSKVDAPAVEWAEAEYVPVRWDHFNPWHLDMIVSDSGLVEMVVCAYDALEPGAGNNAADLYYVTYDLTTGTAGEPQLMLARGPGDSITRRSIYRSSLVAVDGGYYLYYSCIDRKWRRHMGLAVMSSPVGSSLRFLWP